MRSAQFLNKRTDDNKPLMQLHEWQSPLRYYAAYLTWDLFDELVLVMCWGGRTSHRWGSKTVPVESIENGLSQIASLDMRRQARGYLLIT